MTTSFSLRHLVRINEPRVASAILGLALALAAATSAEAANIVVNSTADGPITVDANCTLREAITAANTDAPSGGCAAGTGADTITFQIPGTDTGCASGVCTINLLSADSTDPTSALVISSNMTITGTGADNLIVKRGGSVSAQFRVFSITSAAATAVEISGMTITNGRAPDGANGVIIIGGGGGGEEELVAGGPGGNGGGILSAGNLKLMDFTTSSVAGGPGGNGGGILSAGNLKLMGVTVSGNSGGLGGNGGGGANGAHGGDGGSGGGISSSSGLLTIQNSTVSGNSGGHGGPGGFDGNGGNGGSGGGISSSGPLTIQNSTVSGNSGGNGRPGGFGGGGGNAGSGGGISSSGTLTIQNSAVSGNSGGNGGTGGFGGCNVSFCRTVGGGGSGGHGGGISSSGTLTIQNSTVSGNGGNGGTGGTGGDTNVGLGGPGGPGGSGGGIFSSGTLTSQNNTVSGNAGGNGGNGGFSDDGNGGAGSGGSGGGGGGIFQQGGGPASLANTIVAVNTVAVLGSPGSGPDLSGTFTSQGYNIIGTATGATFTPSTGDQTPVSAAQLKLGPLASNGGPTQTRALLAGSVAIDRGENFDITTDQRGLPRPQDDPATANPSPQPGDLSDIGSFEVQQSVTATKDDGIPAATKKNPGDPVTYTIQINSTGSTDATGVTLTDPTAANTSEVAGSLNVTPVALNDTYPQTVPASGSVNTATSGFTVVTNDYPGILAGNPVPLTDLTISAFSASSANGGSVTMTTSGANVGQFTYAPPPGFTGTDTFTYTISNGVPGAPGSSATGTVSINVAAPPHPPHPLNPSLCSSLLAASRAPA